MTLDDLMDLRILLYEYKKEQRAKLANINRQDEAGRVNPEYFRVDRLVEAAERLIVDIKTEDTE